jgi:membrane-associated phospholipid phosphatase
MLLATSAIAGMVLLARELDFTAPTPLDRAVRARTNVLREYGARRILAPMFPLGLPGGYITIAYLTARWLQRRNARGGPAIVTSAWLGWLVHRAAKVVYRRERPRIPGMGRRTDSYPSGHTTGATALSLTTAAVLARRGIWSRQRAVAVGLAAPALMGMYRIIDDEHWFTDVVGGLLLGSAIGLGCLVTLGDAPSPRLLRRASGALPRGARRRDRRA